MQPWARPWVLRHLGGLQPGNVFFFTRQSATSNQEHRKKDKLRSKESRKIGKSAQKRADEQPNISGHLNANCHGRHVAKSGAVLEIRYRLDSS